MKRSKDQLGPQQFLILGSVCPNMFEPGDTLEAERGARGGITGYRLARAGRMASKAVVEGMRRQGLLDDSLRPTTAGTNLYLRSLMERAA